MLLGLILLPDLSNFIPGEWKINTTGHEIPAQWAVWLCAQQLSLAGLCAMAGWWPRTPGVRPVLVAGMLWYTVQAADELVAGNFFSMGLWEYPILLALFGITLYITRHERGSIIRKHTP